MCNRFVQSFCYAVVVKFVYLLRVVLGYIELIVQFIEAYSYFKSHDSQQKKNGGERPDQAGTITGKMTYAEN
ncbi:hypothetical protein ES703_32039 [subsurface metagenome]